ncbi:G-protein beta WD-40 repeat [Phytophthora cactorum]|nr:G-protein beta WD-40 repeat [Phytophthora cactorum]
MSADGGQATLSDLKEVLKDTLAARGSLDQIKARIRAEIFAALDDQDVPKPKLSNENLIINELIREYFEYNGYRHALSSIRPCINLAMISALAWVPKGASRRIPEKLKLTDDEVKMLREAATEEEEEEQSAMEAAMAEEDVEQQNQDEKDNNGLPASFKMDEYDEEDDDAAINSYLGGGAGAEGNVAMEDDEDEQDDELEMDKDDRHSSANTEEDFSNLEVQVYDDENGALYVHHEINLPAFPLCMAWMDCAPVPLNPTTDRWTAALSPWIWDLNVLDVLEPSATLGGEQDEDLHLEATEEPKTALKPGSHQDAVMSLDWNSSHRNMLASGSGDSTVKVWDITTQKCLYTMAHHSNKVQSVRWNPAETTVLASASFDRTLVVLDGRQPDAFSKFQLSAEVESIAWAPHNPSTIVASSEDGVVVGFDVRMNGSAPLFRFDAHAGAVSAISFSAQVPGLLATAGVDKTVKLWDLKDNAPVCVTSKEMNVGELFTLSFYQDSPFMLGVGGSKGVLALWDTSENEGSCHDYSSDISASFRSPYQLGEELALEEEREKQQQGKKKSGKGKKGKKN